MTDYTIPLFFACGLLLLVALLMLVRSRANLKYKSEQKKSSEAAAEIYYKSELLRTRLEVQEQALHYISNEIQENIGQVLTGVQMKLLALTGRISSKEDAENFSEMTTRMGQSINDLRNLSHPLDGTMIEKIGLIDAIEKELTFVSSIYNLRCTFTYSEGIPDLSGEQDLLLFRIVQEAVTGIYEHAGATEIDIHIGYKAGMLTLHIADNGKGLFPHQYKDKGLGLQHIQDRIKLLKGNLETNTKPGEGTVLVLTCKLNHE